MKKTTDELLKIIEKNKNLTSLLATTQEEFLTMDLTDYLQELLEKKKLTRAAAIERSNLNPNYAYQIFSGIKKEPSRNKLLALAVGMSLTVAETQNLLKISGHPMLYPRIQRDMIILFALEHSFSVIDINEFLEELHEPILE